MNHNSLGSDGFKPTSARKNTEGWIGLQEEHGSTENDNGPNLLFGPAYPITPIQNSLPLKRI